MLYLGEYTMGKILFGNGSGALSIPDLSKYPLIESKISFIIGNVKKRTRQVYQRGGHQSGRTSPPIKPATEAKDSSIQTVLCNVPIIYL